MTKKEKKHAVLWAFFWTFIFTLSILLTAFFIYYGKIDGTLDLEALADGQNRTTKIYAVSADDSPIELESERLYGQENRIWVSLDAIPEHVKNAFIAIEDHRFYEHKGVDFRRTAGAVLSFWGKRTYGGSTITQQLIKNLTGDSAVSVKRKLTEIKRAVTLEKSTSKDRILELYLNTVYLSEGCYGIQTAAEKYFSKEVSDLTLTEAATLAGILRYPSYYDPIRNPNNSLQRRNTVLLRMNEVGFIDAALCEEAAAEPLQLCVSRKSESGTVHSWFTDAVIEDVITDLMNTRGLSRTAASAMLYGGGLSIYTTMRPEIQAELEKVYADEASFPKNKAQNSCESACCIVNSENGDVVALVGGKGEKTSNRLFGLATQMLRSPGSAIKPISVYAPALEEGLITWASVYDDVPCSFYQNQNGQYIAWPKNNPRVYNGLTTVCTAIEKSVNTVAVRVLHELGTAKSFSFCRKAGLSTLVDRRKAADGTAVTDMAEAPLALGATTDGVSVRDLTAAFSMFASDGICSRARTYTKVLDKNGKVLLEKEADSRQLISKENAALMTKMLRRVVESGTGTDVTLGKTLPIAGKTGTSTANTDRWFIGYIPKGLVCGVWCGNRDATDIGEYTGNPAAVVCNTVMTSLYENDLLYKDIPASASEENPLLTPVLYCKDSGKLPCAACMADPRGHRVELGYFAAGTEPTEICDVHVLVRYDTVTQAVACEHCPTENIREIGLIQNERRSFPCPVTVSDAQYIYRPMEEDAAPCEESGKAFFDSLAKEGEFFGTSGKKYAFNRICTEHLRAWREELEKGKEKGNISTDTTLPPGEDKASRSSPKSRWKKWKELFSHESE